MASIAVSAEARRVRTTSSVDDVAVGATGHGLDHQAREDEVGVAVAVFGPGRGARGQVPEQRQDVGRAPRVVRRDPVPARHPRRPGLGPRRRGSWSARGVRQEMVERVLRRHRHRLLLRRQDLDQRLVQPGRPRSTSRSAVTAVTILVIERPRTGSRASTGRRARDGRGRRRTRRSGRRPATRGRRRGRRWRRPARSNQDRRSSLVHLSIVGGRRR